MSDPLRSSASPAPFDLSEMNAIRDRLKRYKETAAAGLDCQDYYLAGMADAAELENAAADIDHLLSLLASSGGPTEAPPGTTPIGRALADESGLRAALLLAVVNAGIDCLANCPQCREETIDAVLAALRAVPAERGQATGDNDAWISCPGCGAMSCNCGQAFPRSRPMDESTKGYRIAGEPVTDAVGEEFGRLIAERDKLQQQVNATNLLAEQTLAGDPPNQET